MTIVPVLYMEKSVVENLTEADIKTIIDENLVDTKYGVLKRYYVGEHKILTAKKNDTTAPNNRLVNNMAKYTTDTAVGYFVGKPVVYSSQNAEYLSRLQDVFDYNDEQDHNMELAKMASVYGNTFEMLYMDEDARIRFAKLEPQNVIIICASGDRSLLAAIRLTHSVDRQKRTTLHAEYWNAREVWRFEAINGSSLRLTGVEEHYWNDVPINEYINNDECMGDFEGIVDLIDAYNRVQSNSANLFQYNDEALMKISKLGDVSSQDIADMKEKGAIILEDGGDIDWMLKVIDDTALENYKKRLREDMHIFSNIPNMTDESFGGNLSGVAVSYKLWGLEQICAIKERKFKRALQRRIELITNIFRIQGSQYDFTDIAMQFRRNKPQNLLEIAQIITQLAPDLSRETRLKMLPTVDNVQDELEKLEAEQQAEISRFGEAQRFAQTTLPAAAEGVVTSEP